MYKIYLALKSYLDRNVKVQDCFIQVKNSVQGYLNKGVIKVKLNKGSLPYQKGGKAIWKNS